MDDERCGGCVMNYERIAYLMRRDYKSSLYPGRNEEF